MRAAASLAAILLLACQRAPLPTAVLAADAAAARQLVRGFHAVEDGWRWTGRAFSVRLGLPPNSAGRGAMLFIDVAAPQALIAANHDATLACSCNGVSTPPETFASDGRHTYLRQLDAIAGADALIECTVDKVLPPSATDRRELGLIFFGARLEPIH